MKYNVLIILVLVHVCFSWELDNVDSILVQRIESFIREIKRCESPRNCIKDELKILFTNEKYRYKSNAIIIDHLKDNINDLEEVKSINILTRDSENKILCYYSLIVIFENEFQFWNVTMLNSNNNWDIIELSISPYSKQFRDSIINKELVNEYSENMINSYQSLKSEVSKDRVGNEKQNKEINKTLQLIYNEVQKLNNNKQKDNN